MKVRIDAVKTKVSENGNPFQAIRIQVCRLDGGRFWKDAWIPIERGHEPLGPGRYEVSDRSFYVNRLEGVGFYPRLDFVCDLEDDSVPEIAAAAAPEPVKAPAGSWASDVPF